MSDVIARGHFIEQRLIYIFRSRPGMLNGYAPEYVKSSGMSKKNRKKLEKSEYAVTPLKLNEMPKTN